MKKSFQHSVYDRIFGFLGVITIYTSIAYFAIANYNINSYGKYFTQAWVIAVVIWLVVLFLLFSFYILVRQVFLLRDQEFVVKQWGREKQIPYHAFIQVKESMSGLALFTPNDKIIISDETERYDELYNLLMQKIPIFDELDRHAFPWKLASSKKGSRQFIFDSNQIFINSDYQNSTLHPKEIKRIYIDPITDGNRTTGYGYNQYEVIIQLKNSKRIIIDGRESRRFKCPPERILANLHSLYPFTKEVPPLSATEHGRLLMAKGEKFYRAGEYQTAALAYEQLLETDSLNHHVWQRFADCLFELEQFTKAGEAYRQAVMLDNTDAESYWRGAIAFSKTKNTIMAKLYLQEALTLSPALKADLKQYQSLQELI